MQNKDLQNEIIELLQKIEKLPKEKQTLKSSLLEIQNNINLINIDSK